MLTHHETKKIESCNITRDDLSQLLTIVKKDYPPNFGLELLAEYENVNAKWNDIDEMFSTPNLPDQLLNFTIRVWTPEVYYQLSELNYKVDITINNLYPSFSVSGSNEIWVLGKRDQLLKFFEKKISNQYKILKIVHNYFMVSIFISVGLVFLLNYVLSAQLIIQLLYTITFVYFSLLYVNWVQWGLNNNVKLVIRKNISTLLGKERKEIIELLLTFIGLVISIIQTLK